MSTSDASKELARIDIHEAALQGTMNYCFRARKLHLQTVILTDLLMSETWPVFETIFATFKARQMRVRTLNSLRVEQSSMQVSNHSVPPISAI